MPGRPPLDEHAAASVLAYAADQRAAKNGYPAPETGVLWETARDAHLARLADEQPRVA
ncbi:hypothetical protein AB0B78_31270 [Streptomyces sp. NPDC040724]|uniref:hypothetical protein n=1 Tax=Streptomyces sp. NPDC040724 TaxID=3155612 RepID=UPI0033FDFD05